MSTNNKEQTKPLAPTSTINTTNQHPTIPMHQETTKKQHRRRRIFLCATATTLILATIIITLAFTVFKVRDPKMTLNSITIDRWPQVAWTNLQPSMNITLTANISIKNDNYASFKYRNGTTSLFYDGGEVVEAINPAGNARARKTEKLDIEIILMVDKILGKRRFGGDVMAGKLPVSSRTEISGKVSVLKIVKKTVDVKMDCSFVLNIQTQQIDDLSCSSKVSL